MFHFQRMDSAPVRKLSNYFSQRYPLQNNKKGLQTCYKAVSPFCTHFLYFIDSEFHFAEIFLTNLLEPSKTVVKVVESAFKLILSTWTSRNSLTQYHVISKRQHAQRLSECLVSFDSSSFSSQEILSY